jgi:hypothetical protein
VVIRPEVSGGSCVRKNQFLDPRMFLSGKGLLGHVTKLRRCSDIVKPQPVWYMATGRKRAQHQKCWSHRICSGGKEIPHDRQIWSRCRRVILETFRGFDYREKRDVLVHKLPMPKTPMSQKYLHRRSQEKSLTIGSSRR